VHDALVELLAFFLTLTRAPLPVLPIAALALPATALLALSAVGAAARVLISLHAWHRSS
jgi:hypothetical protein